MRTLRTRVGGRAFAALCAVVVGLAMLLANAPPAAACTCAPLSLDEKIEKSDVALIGREVSRHPVEGRPGTVLPTLEVTIAVETVLMGDVGETFTVVTNGNPATCGIGPLVDRGSVGIVASDFDGLFPIGACGGVYDARVLEAEFSVRSAASASATDDGSTITVGEAQSGTDGPEPAVVSSDLSAATGEQPGGSWLLLLALSVVALVAVTGAFVVRRAASRRHRQ